MFEEWAARVGARVSDNTDITTRDSSITFSHEGFFFDTTVTAGGTVRADKKGPDNSKVGVEFRDVEGFGEGSARANVEVGPARARATIDNDGDVTVDIGLGRSGSNVAGPVDIGASGFLGGYVDPDGAGGAASLTGFVEAGPFRAGGFVAGRMEFIEWSGKAKDFFEDLLHRPELLDVFVDDQNPYVDSETVIHRKDGSTLTTTVYSNSGGDSDSHPGPGRMGNERTTQTRVDRADGSSSTTTNYSNGSKTKTDTDSRGNGSHEITTSNGSSVTYTQTEHGADMPLILDLTGSGIDITELSQSTVFMDATGDGLLNRTAWAAEGNGVLFYDPDNTGEISETRQYVFTEWDPTATSDIEALRSVFDSNGDGVFDASDAEFANFKVMVTNADGSLTAQSLSALNIVSIDLTADATHIELPDGSIITGQTTFTYVGGATGTVADTTLIAEADSHRVDQVESVDGSAMRRRGGPPRFPGRLGGRETASLPRSPWGCTRLPTCRTFH